MIRTILQRVSAGEQLSRSEMDQWISTVMAGGESEPVVAAVLSILAYRGESVSELSGALDALKRVMIPFPSRNAGPLFDTCGTGGDGKGTFNVSTTVAIVLAAGGIPVVKHGGRAVSSRSGSADVLEALGIRVDLPVERSIEIFSELGVVFLWAPLYHPALKGLAPLRRSLQIRTLLNLIAPLANPAGVTRQMLGVSSSEMVSPMAQLLASHGSQEFFVVCGQGLDEVTLEGRTTFAIGRGGEIHEGTFTARDFGLPLTPVSAISGGDPFENASIIRRVLSGEEGPYLDYVLANAALGFQITGHANDPIEGVQMARDVVMSRRAEDLLERWRELCQTRS